MNFLTRQKGFWKQSEGGFTVEASLVLPVVLFVTASLLLLCLYVYQRSFLVQAASAAAERSAYIWDNSTRDASNGYAEPGSYDPLYWRLTDDQLVASLFGGSGEIMKKSVFNIPSSKPEEADLPLTKLYKGAVSVPAGMNGEMGYEHKLLIRKVNVELSWPRSLALLNIGMKSEAGQEEIQTHSVVVDPVEFIRTFELMRYYGSKFKTGTSSGEAADVLQRYGRPSR